MMQTIGQASIRRAGDRQPLRLEIGRRLARTAAGAEKFVTEVRLGDGAALVVPWRQGGRSDRSHPSGPRLSTRRISAPVAS